MRTYSPKPGEIERQWHVIDASDVVLGRLATHAATLLRGKHKPIFAPHVDTGDFVVIINAGKVALTGNKRQTKVAYRHSGYPGGLKQVGYEELLTKRPERAVELAVKGMLPHNKLAPSAHQEAEGLPGRRAPARRAAARAVRDQADRAVSAGRRKQMTDIVEPEVAETVEDARGRRDRPRRPSRPWSSSRRPRRPGSAPPRPGDRPIQTVGRRKEAIVRVRLIPGTGKITCNGRDLEAYFPSKVHQQLIREPLVTAEKAETFDVIANLRGGGITGQAGALRLGIARALITSDADDRPALKKAGFLTRDARVKESKKYGLKKARKAPQYSKR